MTSEKEQKNREELFRLMAENPDLPVVAMVDSDIVADDNYARWMGSWGSCCIGKYISGEEYIHFFEEDDFGEIEGALTDGPFTYEEFESMSDEKAKSVYDALPWIKAIIVNIDTP